MPESTERNPPKWFFDKCSCGCLYDEYGVNAVYCKLHKSWTK